MAWFDPSIQEMSIIEQIETAHFDKEINPRERRELLNRLWKKLESIHGHSVLRLVNPEGYIIFSPQIKG